MREIKFRAWDKDKGEMFQLWKNPISELALASLPIMQYTGLKDKNGKEIYEGDILSGYVNDYPIEVAWEPSIGGWYTNNNIDNEYGHTGTLSIGVAKHVEVIGNIYEHKHLLEGGDDTQS